jgi:putative transposase
VRRWVLKFDPSIARRLRRQRPRPSDLWHLDEMVVRIAGKRMCVPLAGRRSRAEVPDMLVQRRRDGRAALRLLRSWSRSRASRRNCWSPTAALLRRGVPASPTDLSA